MPAAPAEVARKVVTPTGVEFTANSRGVSTEVRLAACWLFADTLSWSVMVFVDLVMSE